MSQKDNKKTILLLAGCVAVLATTALIFYKYSQKEISEVPGALTKEDKKCLENIKKLGPPQFNSKTNKLEFDYLIRFCEVVGLHAKTKQKVKEIQFIKERREHLKAGNEEKYKEIIQQMIDMEQTISDDALALAAKAIDMDSDTIEAQLTEATHSQINAHRLAELQQKISL